MNNSKDKVPIHQGILKEGASFKETMLDLLHDYMAETEEGGRSPLISLLAETEEGTRVVYSIDVNMFWSETVNIDDKEMLGKLIRNLAADTEATEYFYAAECWLSKMSTKEVDKLKKEGKQLLKPSEDPTAESKVMVVYENKDFATIALFDMEKRASKGHRIIEDTSTGISKAYSKDILVKDIQRFNNVVYFKNIKDPENLPKYGSKWGKGLLRGARQKGNQATETNPFAGMSLAEQNMLIALKGAAKDIN